jgi:hypothetical protein
MYYLRGLGREDFKSEKNPFALKHEKFRGNPKSKKKVNPLILWPFTFTYVLLLGYCGQKQTGVAVSNVYKKCKLQIESSKQPQFLSNFCVFENKTGKKFVY